jgi:hypothetical protein
LTTISLDNVSRKLAVEEEVRMDSVGANEECWLSNGVRGFIFGRINLV